ncbi:MAG: alpha-galactosidase [Candidatus Hydrogenedentes bacterium]|nr:alpha-galactosidase [Candidatus Hydrogenedentota bacterium]
MDWHVGEWAIEFEPASSTLACSHEASGARLSGPLSFLVEGADGPTPWTIVVPRDSVDGRPALLDENGDVQGYLTVSGLGGAVRITAVHRAAQSYRGTLTYRARAALGAQIFACRTRPQADYRVVQMASGPADSALNDSLFDIATDTALRFDGRSVSIRTGAPGDGAPRFDVAVTAAVHDAAHAALVFELVPEYYRARYVPYYTPIDRTRCPSPPTGWMSWNTYFDTAGEKENLDEARVGAEHLKPFGLEIWHIESWQDNSDKLPVSEFHNLTLRPNPRQFPRGMKWLADQIRELGFVPGIWTVPFGTGDAAFYESHKDWFLHDAAGKPMRNWCGLYVLDPSQEAVRRHMENTHRTMAEDWGYEYFKIDGMSGRHSSYSAHFYERDEVRAAFKEPCEDPFRLCVEALRRGIGPDRIWLACQGHYSGPEIGLADAGRIGADIVGVNRPPDWHNYRNQAWTTLNQLFVNNIVWYCDPDTLLVGEAAPLGMVRLATSVVGLPGQMMFAGDKLAQLPPERMRLLQQCLPVCDVRPLDLFPIFEMSPVWDLKIHRPFAEWDVVSLFNWEEDAHDIAFSFEEIGLPPDGEYLVWDFWAQAFRGACRQGFHAAVPGQSNALLAIHRALGRPQFLSTERHITQGGTSLEALAWDDAARTLSGRVRLVEHDPARLTFYVPEGYALREATADGADRVESVGNPDGTATLVLERATPGAAAFQLAFD